MRQIVLGIAGMMTLVACSEPEVILPGQREVLREAAPVAEATKPATKISLGAPTANAAWTQRVGTPSTRTTNPAFSASAALRWSAEIGQGDSRRARIMTDPVVAGGRIFTMDAASRLTATSETGATLWQTQLVPERDNDTDAVGGGLAYGDGALYVTTGFGELYSVDPASGAINWTQDIRSSGTTSPSYFDGVVYVVAGDATAWAIEAKTGRVRWTIDALSDAFNIESGAAPAVNQKYAVFSFGSGDLIGAFRNGGLRMWGTTVSGTRLGAAVSSISDITGDPVIVGDTVYAGNNSGRTVALNLATGKRIWTAKEGTLGQIWPAGGSLFFVTDRNRLVRLDAATGETVWAESLPNYVTKRPRKIKQIEAHYGPVVAGGLVVVASDDGLIRLFDPQNGTMVRTIDIPSGATTAPVFANGTLYVVNKRGQLLAFR